MRKAEDAQLVWHTEHILLMLVIIVLSLIIPNESDAQRG
jgi:hypothetical protein